MGGGCSSPSTEDLKQVLQHIQIRSPEKNKNTNSDDEVEYTLIPHRRLYRHRRLPPLQSGGNLEAAHFQKLIDAGYVISKPR